MVLGAPGTRPASHGISAVARCNRDVESVLGC